jgi:hypothetical protein
MAQPVNPPLNSFVAGEVSPLLYGRTDLDWYKSACQQVRNMVTLTEGAATRRPPTRFVAEVADSTSFTIVKPFVFKQGQARVIEFGGNYIRFYADKGQIISGGIPYGITSYYADYELRGLKFEQSADVLFIFHPNHAPAQLERHSDTDWRLVDVAFGDGPYLEVNTDDGLTLQPSGIDGAITIVAVAGGGQINIPVWQVVGSPPYVSVLPLNVKGVSFAGNVATLPAGIARDRHRPGDVPGRQPAVAAGRCAGPHLLLDLDRRADRQVRRLGRRCRRRHLHRRWARRRRSTSSPPTDIGRLIRIGDIADNWQKAHAYAVGAAIKNQNQGVYRCTAAGTSQDVDNAGPNGTGVGIGDGTVTWDYVNAGGIEYGYVRITGFTDPAAVSANVVLPLPGSGCDPVLAAGRL